MLWRVALAVDTELDVGIDPVAQRELRLRRGDGRQARDLRKEALRRRGADEACGGHRAHPERYGPTAAVFAHLLGEVEHAAVAMQRAGGYARSSSCKTPNMTFGECIDKLSQILCKTGDRQVDENRRSRHRRVAQYL